MGSYFWTSRDFFTRHTTDTCSDFMLWLSGAAIEANLVDRPLFSAECDSGEGCMEA